MPTRDGEGMGSAAKRVADHAKALVGLEVELAKLELKRKVGAMGVGVGLGLAAALLSLFAVGFLFTGIALALAIALDAWLAVLIVAAGLLAIAGLLGMLALRAFKQATPPVPEQAIREARLTTEAIKSDGNGQR
jgi:hypothetical protein